MAVKPIPEDMPGVIPMLAFKSAAKAIAFYERVFGAVEIMRLAEPGGKIGHAEIGIGKAVVMLADEYPEHNTTPQRLGGSAVILHMYVPDVDAVFGKAIAAGAKAVREPQDEFYGDRAG